MTTSTRRAPKIRGKEPVRALPAAPDPEAIVLGHPESFDLGDLQEVELDLIVDPPVVPDRIPRPTDAANIAGLARSIREVGLRQPICVEIGEKDWGGEGKFVRAFGRRRIEACRINAREHGGKKTIIAFVTKRFPPEVRRTVVAIENIQREGLTAAEEHLAVLELAENQSVNAAMQLGKTVPAGTFTGKKLTPEIVASVRAAPPQALKRLQEELLKDPAIRARAAELVAAMLAKPKAWVNERLYLGRLSDKARALVLEEKLPLTHARLICRVADPAVRDELSKRYAVGGSDAVGDHQAGAIEDLEDEVSERLFKLSVVPWKLSVPFADGPACDGCPSNSATNPGLFEGGAEASSQIVGGIGRGHGDVKDGAAVCTDHRCFARKMAGAKSGIAAGAKSIVDSGKKIGDVLAARPYLAEGPLAKKVRDRQASRGSGGSSSRSSSGSSGGGGGYVDSYDTPRAKAKRAWEDAVQKWAVKAIAVVEKKIDSIPGARSTFMVLQRSKAWTPYINAADDKQRLVVESPGMLANLKKLISPSWEQLLKIEADRDPKGYGNDYDELLSQYTDGESGMVSAVASVLAVATAPMPALNTFLAPVIAAENKGKAKGSGAKPAKVGKKAAPKKNVVEDAEPDSGDDE